MKVTLANPRGFCAGVERAIQCVERALERYGSPIYVLNNIVHNAAVVGELHEKGAIFVKDLKDVPRGSHLLFSAHGVGPDRWKQAKELELEVIDATCPLVEKVHNEARRFQSKGYTILLIGEEGHDETSGTMGWAAASIKRVFTLEDVEALELPPDAKLAYLTQTTLSVDDCRKVTNALKKKFPHIQDPPSDDICYATQNRQAAVKALAQDADLILVVGDPESANSNRLAEICRSMGKPSHLISSADAIREEWLENIEHVLITAGASAPESLVQNVISYLESRATLEVEEVSVVTEDVHFKLPVTIA